MNPYKVLGLSEDASIEEVEESYKKKVKEKHPDVGGSSDEFIRIKRAYEVITEEHQQSESIDLSDKDELIFVYPAKVNYVNYKDIVSEYRNKPTIGDMQDYFKNTDCDNFTVEKDQYILEAAESAGNSWPYFGGSRIF